MKYIKYKVDLVRYYCRFLIKRKEFKLQKPIHADFKIFRIYSIQIIVHKIL